MKEKKYREPKHRTAQEWYIIKTMKNIAARIFAGAIIALVTFLLHLLERLFDYYCQE